MSVILNLITFIDGLQLLYNTVKPLLGKQPS